MDRSMRLARHFAAFLVLSVMVLPTSEVLAQNLGASDIADIGALCVDPRDSGPDYVVRLVNSAGGRISRDEKWNHCDAWSEQHLSFIVPFGMERWTSEYLAEQGFSVFHALSTAGGSGYFKRRVPREYVFAAGVRPGLISQAINESECRLKTRLSEHFDEVNITRACRNDFPEEEQCWNFWVAGHLSSSKGLGPQHLENQVDDGYWFSSRLQIWFGDIANYRTNDGDFIGPVARIDLATISTKFARAPVSAKPSGSRYYFISSFDGSVHDDYLDELIADRIIDILSSRPMVCAIGLG